MHRKQPLTNHGPDSLDDALAVLKGDVQRRPQALHSSIRNSPDDKYNDSHLQYGQTHFYFPKGAKATFSDFTLFILEAMSVADASNTTNVEVNVGKPGAAASTLSNSGGSEAPKEQRLSPTYLFR
jgi:hypothetical protein